MASKLTDKQAAFVKEYLVDLNATQAAIRAGYSQKTAAIAGFENLRKPNIADAVQKAKTERSKRVQIDADEVLREVQRRAFTGLSKFIRVNSDGQPIVDLSAATPSEIDCLTEATTEGQWVGQGEDAVFIHKVKIKLGDNGKYLDMLMKHLGLFAPEKLDVKVSGMTNEEILDELAAIASRNRAD